MANGWVRTATLPASMVQHRKRKTLGEYALQLREKQKAKYTMVY
jgi:hypothetical protein